MDVGISNHQFQYHLTPRERDVMNCIAGGLGTRQICRSMGISINTVKYHLRNIYAKLGADNRQKAVQAYELRMTSS